MVIHRPTIIHYQSLKAGDWRLPCVCGHVFQAAEISAMGAAIRYGKGAWRSINKRN